MRGWLAGFGGTLALATTMLFTFAGRPTAAAQTAPAPLDAQAVVGLVQAFYDQTTTFEADFHQTQFTKLYNRTERANGRVVFKKPGMMRFDYAQPNGQVFVCDGRQLLVYQPPEEGETEGQLIERSVQSELPQAFGFLLGTGNLGRDFTARLLDPAQEGFAGGYVLELRPNQPTPHYERLLFYVQIVEQGGRRAGVLRRILILDAAGNRNRFDFTNPRFNRDVPASRFRYSPPRGTRRVQP